MLLHVTQRLRDKRDIAAARAALVAELEGQGKTIVEDAGHYADEEALYVSAANRADGEPATEDRRSWPRRFVRLVRSHTLLSPPVVWRRGKLLIVRGLMLGRCRNMDL